MDQIIRDPKNTVSFDAARHKAIMERVEKVGADGKLLRNAKGELIRACGSEKLIIPLLAKMSNSFRQGVYGSIPSGQNGTTPTTRW